MAITVLPLFLLPTMDSERFEKCTFSLNDMESVLTITMTDLPPYIVHFHRLRWHRFTPHEDCKPAMIQGCEMAVGWVENSPALKAYVQKSALSAKDAALLHHYRIYLGKGGCHEAFAQSAYGSGPGSLDQKVAAITTRVKQKLKGGA